MQLVMSNEFWAIIKKIFLLENTNTCVCARQYSNTFEVSGKSILTRKIFFYYTRYQKAVAVLNEQLNTCIY